MKKATKAVRQALADEGDYFFQNPNNATEVSIRDKQWFAEFFLKGEIEFWEKRIMNAIGV